MQKVLSSDLWREIGVTAKRARQRKAAIAYVTRDLVGFRAGDVLVLDASRRAISSGETDAKLLGVLHRKGVHLYHCGDLHAKVLLLDDTAVVGSGNMSASSASALVEAAVMTDHGSTVAGVASLIEQLVKQSERLTSGHVAELCKIKVIRRGGRGTTGRRKQKTTVRRLGNQTWLVGVHQLVSVPKPEAQKMIDKAAKELRLSEDDLDWMRWGGKSRFVGECREGDLVIEIWRANKAKHPSMVTRARPVLLRQKGSRWTRFYIEPSVGSRAELSWGKFKRLLKKLGYPRHVGPNIAQLVDPDMADAIAKNWNSFAKG